MRSDSTSLPPLARPVRVLHVVYALHPGGMEHGVVKLANGLDPAAVHSAICATTPGGALTPMVSAHVPVFELRRRQGNDPSLVWQLARLFRRVRPDIVHTHAWGTLVEGWLAARLARVPVVVHGEHGTLQDQPHQIWMQRRVWRRVDRVLSVSSRLAEKLSAATGFPLDRITVIRNGVDLSRFGTGDRRAARAALGLAEEAVVVGTAGRLVDVKDQARLIEAVTLMGQRGVTVDAVIAGDGPLRAALEARIQAHGLGARVRLLGHQPAIERVLAALDVFVLSSRSEGLSNTILEAMASGLPVVATRVGGADELVMDGETGVLVPAESATALAEAIATVACGPDRGAAMGARGRARAHQVFGTARMLRDYTEFYRRSSHGVLPSDAAAGVRDAAPWHPAER